MADNEVWAKALKWADSLVAKTRQHNPPVDLLRVANFVDIKRVLLQLMITRGAMVAITGGFEAYLRSVENTQIDTSAEETPDLLSSRQRFTLAHEIAHTYFYRRPRDKGIPRPKQTFKDERELEDLCDRAAARIIAPTAMLAHVLSGTPEGPEGIDATLVHALTLRFRTSPRVLIEGLRRVDPSNLFDRCILFITRSKGFPEVVTWYRGPRMLSTLPIPKQPYHPLTDWLPQVPPSLIEGEDREWETTAGGRAVIFRRLSWGSRGDFFLQVDGK